MQLIKSERLSITELQLSDAAVILRLLNEPTFINNIADKGVRTIKDTVAYLENGPIASYRQHGFGLWKVILRETNQVIGMCGLIKRENLEDIDLGYALFPEYVGRGFAQEATLAVLAYAKQALSLKRLVAIVNEKNIKSIALLGRLGFHYEKKFFLSESDEVLLYGFSV